jgi:spore coat protein CotH
MSRIRNRVLTDLWNAFCTKPYYIKQEKKAMSGTRGHFVELVLNDEYRGIYCMTENLDRKQMKLKKIDEETQTVHGQLWKSKDWSYGVFMGHDSDNNNYPKRHPSSYNEWSEMWENYEVKYPDFDDYGYQTDWSTLYDAVDFVCTATDANFRQHFTEYFDLPVVMDYYILMETILSTDNHGKNMFFACYDKQEDKRITLAVWDMDATCGQRWSDDYYHDTFLGPEQDYAQFITRYEHGDYNLFRRLRNTNTEDFNMQVRLRYRDLRQNELATENILNRFRTYLDEFKRCGADQREYDKWSFDSDVAHHQLNFDVEMDYLTYWFTHRMDYLDRVRFKIDELPSDISDINRMEDAKAHNAIYDLQGQKVGTADDYDRLSAGIYIINGKKSVKK